VRPLTGHTPLRRVQAPVMRDHRAPVARAVLEALAQAGARRAGRPAQREP
jgi:hypothetical protein